jgi:hypothetical protein
MVELHTVLCADACVTALHEISDGQSVREVIEEDFDALFRSPEARRALYQLSSAVDCKRFSERSRGLDVEVRDVLSDETVDTVRLPPLDELSSPPAISIPIRCAVICSKAPSSPGTVGLAAAPVVSPDLLARRVGSAPITPCTPAESGHAADPAGVTRASKRIANMSASATRPDGTKKRSRYPDESPASSEELTAQSRGRGLSLGKTPERPALPASCKP